MSIDSLMDVRATQLSPQPSIAVLLPCLNEEGAIVETVANFRRALPHAEIYVYDNGSTDHTPHNAKLAGADVRHTPHQTAWSWLHKIRRAMVRPERPPLSARVEADETYVGGPRPGRPGRGAGGKTKVAGAVESARGRARGRRLGRLRLAVVQDVSARSLEGFLGRNVARPATVATDGWSGYAGLATAGYAHEPLTLRASWGDAALRLPAIHLVFGLAKRWLLGTHHGAVSPKHLPAYLDEFVFRFNRRTAKSISHRFARLIEHAVQIQPTTYRTLVTTLA